METYRICRATAQDNAVWHQAPSPSIALLRAVLKEGLNPRQAGEEVDSLRPQGHGAWGSTNYIVEPAIK